MRRKYVFLTGDIDFKNKLISNFTPAETTFCSLAEFPAAFPVPGLLVIDGDTLSLHACLQKLDFFQHKKIPTVFIFSNRDAKEVMAILKNGAISVLFKNEPADGIKKELKDILYNFNYLQQLKEKAAHHTKMNKLLDVVKTLTSNSDINDIMYSILTSMQEVFKLQSIAFFLVVKNKLKHKLNLGNAGRSITPDCEWDIHDLDSLWLRDLQKMGKPIIITHKSKRIYKKYFQENTILLPVVIKNKFSGLIVAIPDTPNALLLSKNNITLLNAFAEQTSVALENARLYRDVIKAREELIQQEKKSLLGQIMLSLNHEINNPLSIISMEAQLLQKRMANNEKPIEDRIARIESNIERIKMILETISSLNVDDQITTEYIHGKTMLNLNNVL